MDGTKAVAITDPLDNGNGESVDTPLSITLFGPLHVLVSGEPLPHLRARKVLWLLALLTLRAERPVEREWLAGILWPDTDQNSASRNLRVILSELRAALGSQGARIETPSRHTLSLKLAGANVDVLTFDAAIKRGTPTALEAAVALYQGPLLEGCLEEWVPQERNARQQSCLLALQTLANSAKATGDHGREIGYWRRAIGIDPLWDTARHGLMEALDRSGDTNTALHVYHEFVELLKNDPTAAPNEATTALYTRLRAATRQRGSVKRVVSEEKATVPVVTGYLPHPLTDLIGREDERSEVVACLRRSRLVTLTGMGGIGKTRLAVAVATDMVREYADGAWMVSLESITQSDQIARQVALVLGIREEAGKTLPTTLRDHLISKRLLLVLDNCEHLLEACAELSGMLLRECSGVRILATSREALGITGEAIWAVPSLAVPDPDHLPPGSITQSRVLSGYEGVQLFLARAQDVQKTFALTASNAPAVAKICYQLEGIPLALELAAARVKSLSVEQIAARLGDGLGLLTRGDRTAQSRQQTLRAALDWSYDLLSEPERLLLQRLSVFAGGWTLEAAEQICSGERIVAEEVQDLLTSLVDKSLVVFEAREMVGGRYRFLEMVRQYAAECLQASGEAALVRTRHRNWCLAFAEEAAPALKGADQVAWLRRVETEYDNLRIALTGNETGAEEAERGLRLTGALWWFWKIRGRFSEGRQYLEAALERMDAQGETEERAKALNAAGSLAYNQGDYATAQAHHEESLAICRNLGNRSGMAAALNSLGNVASRLSDAATIHELFQQSLDLYRELGDKQGIAMALSNLGNIARLHGDYGTARAQLEESLALRRGIGDDQGVGLVLANLGNLACLQGDYGMAQTHLEESLAVRRRLGDKQGTAFTLTFMGSVADALGDYAAARALFEEGLGLRREVGEKRGVAWSLSNLGNTAIHEGRFAQARERFEESLAIFRELGERGGIASSLNRLGNVACRFGDYALAQQQFVDSLGIFRDLKNQEGVAENLRDLAEVYAIQGESEKALHLWGAAEALCERIGASLPPVERARYDRQIEQARSGTDSATFVAAWEAGRALTWEQAVSYALEERSPATASPV